MSVWLTAANQEQPVVGRLHILKVQREGFISADLQLVKRLCVHVIPQDKFAVAFEEPNFLQGIPLVLARARFFFHFEVHRNIRFCFLCRYHFDLWTRLWSASLRAVLVSLSLDVIHGEFRSLVRSTFALQFVSPECIQVES